ncbi:MAG: carboxypeptidase regulatory-like domain-containing protein [Nibricoccus sp.]
MSAGDSKRAVAEIRFGEDRAGVAKVGGRSIHQYWSMLSPHFRDVFLAPQRRSDDGGVSWTWREPAEKQPLTAAELAGVRNRMERAKESFEENPVSPLMNEARGGGASSQEIVDQLMVRVKALAEGLVGKPDAALAEYVCRTETGVMVHSWGLDVAAKISHPDSQESAVSGKVMFGGNGSAGNDVVIENARGLRVARTTTDERGEFNFTKLAPGRYRVRVISGPGEFSKKGILVTVERGETSRIELRSTSDPVASTAGGTEEAATENAAETNAPIVATKRRTWIWGAALAALFLFGGGGWIWFSYFRSAKSDTQTTQRVSTLTPEKFSSAKSAPPAEAQTYARNHSPGSGLGAVVDGSGDTKLPTVRRETPSIDVPTLSSSAELGMGSVSKIGTRVELSGVSSADINPKSSGSTSDSRAMPSPTSSPDASLEKRSNSAEPSSGMDTDARVKNSTATSVATSRPEAESRPPADGAPAEALSGHLPVGAMGAMPESPAGSDTERKQGVAINAGLAPEDKKAGAGKGSGLPMAVRAEKKTSSEDAAGASSNGRAASVGAGVQRISGQGPEASVSVVEKPVKKSQTPIATDVGNPAGRPSDLSSDPSSPGDSDEVDEKPNNRKEPRTASKASKPAPSEGPEGATTSSSVSSASGTGTPRMSESAESEQPETPDTANGSSVTSSDAGAPDTPAGDKNSSSTAGLSAPEKIGDAARGTGLPQSKSLPAGMQIVGSVKLGRWSLGVGRDAIVPTMPLREGATDLAEALRRKMSEEQKARLPATLKHPKLLSGFAFKFASGVKPRPLRWSAGGEPGLTFAVENNRAEMGWLPSEPPRQAVFTLTSSDGAEMARVEFDSTGRATVAVKSELRAMFLLGVWYAETERPVSGGASRIAWQVVRGPLASTAWTYDSRWREGGGCRLEVVLNGANPANTRIALVDQASGWQLATELE